MRQCLWISNYAEVISNTTDKIHSCVIGVTTNKWSIAIIVKKLMMLKTIENLYYFFGDFIRIACIPNPMQCSNGMYNCSSDIIVIAEYS